MSKLSLEVVPFSKTRGHLGDLGATMFQCVPNGWFMALFYPHQWHCDYVWLIDWLIDCLIGGLNDNTLALIGLKERNIFILAWNVITPHSFYKKPHTVPWFLCVQVPWRLFSLCWRIRWRGWNVSRAAAWLRELDRWLVTTGNSLLEQFETFGD